MSERAGYLYTPEQTAGLRREWTQGHLLPALQALFARLPALRSACVLVAQYWNDEADDAVHCAVVVSELDAPDIAAASRAFEEIDDGDPVNLPTLHSLQLWGADYTPSTLEPYGLEIRWDDNHDAVSLWAAYTLEGGSQNLDGLEAYAPVLRVIREGEALVVREHWPMRRPWLDGIRPLWSGA